MATSTSVSKAVATKLCQWDKAVQGALRETSMPDTEVAAPQEVPPLRLRLLPPSLQE